MLTFLIGDFAFAFLLGRHRAGVSGRMSFFSSFSFISNLSSSSSSSLSFPGLERFCFLVGLPLRVLLFFGDCSFLGVIGGGVMVPSSFCSLFRFGRVFLNRCHRTRAAFAVGVPKSFATLSQSIWPMLTWSWIEAINFFVSELTDMIELCNSIFRKCVEMGGK